ncbi:MAG TPA: hypothetical protein PK718_01860 [Candidatus Methanofastidiosa archaeon]|nr:hypothetical protein [Candidatus Methanofastidiosa archaeon]HPR41276.1 hypothetical protein [Candidatus Methanofastidiosa archaeon]
MLGSLSRDYKRLNGKEKAKDISMGAILGAAFALFNMFGYNIIMEAGAERYLDIFTVEAWEMYVNYAMVVALLIVTYLLVRFIKNRMGLSSIFTLTFMLSFVLVGWIYVSAVVWVTLLRIKYLVT